MLDSKNKKIKKIAIILPYFGKLPNYFNLFLKSCEYNEDIDFLIFTDCKISNEKLLHENIKIFYYSFNEMREKTQNCFDFKISLLTPYILCNFKPAYGLIFEDELQEYDIWGYCDADIIFGQIRKIITDDILEKYERVYPWGHFSLHWNTEEVNRRFMLPLNDEVVYKEMLTQKVTNAFDEWGKKGVSKIYVEHQLSVYKKRDMANIKFNHYQFILDSDVNIPNRKQVFVWDKGNLYREYINDNNRTQRESFIYIHLQKRPMKLLVKNNEKYLIVPNKFIDYPEEGISTALIRKYSRKHLIYGNNIKRWYQGNIVRRVNKLKGMLWT